MQEEFTGDEIEKLNIIMDNYKYVYNRSGKIDHKKLEEFIENPGGNQIIFVGFLYGTANDLQPYFNENMMAHFLTKLREISLEQMNQITEYILAVINFPASIEKQGGILNIWAYILNEIIPDREQNNTE